jgi:hypothetical protein
VKSSYDSDTKFVEAMHNFTASILKGVTFLSEKDFKTKYPYAVKDEHTEEKTDDEKRDDNRPTAKLSD